MTKNTECSVYILRGANGHLYTGVSNDVQKRLEQHNGIIKGGARYTRARRPYVVVYIEMHPSRSAAQKREYAIKQMSRAHKIQLIEAQK
jgi:putative endonuclease